MLVELSAAAGVGAIGFPLRVGPLASTTAPDPVTPLDRSPAASVVLTKFVPSERRTFAAAPAVAGYVAVDHAGSTPEPRERRICPEEPVLIELIAELPSPTSNP